MSAEIPPRVATALLRVITPEDDRESLLADLEAEFLELSEDATRARRWYWHQTVCSIPPLIRRRLHLVFDARRRVARMPQDSTRFSGWFGDCRFAWRVARRAPAVSLSVIAAVALGIAAATAIVSVMEGVFLKSLPFRDASQLVRLGTRMEGFGEVSEVNFLDAADWRRRTTTLSTLASYDVSPTAIRLSPGQPARAATVLSAGVDLDRVLGIRPARGRWFAPEEQVFGGPAVVLLSDRFWRTRLGGDPMVVGRHIDVGGDDHTIVGVLPDAASRFPAGGADVWTPLTFPADSFLNGRGSIALGLVGRLRPGVSDDAARSDLSVIAAALAREYPDTNGRRGVTLNNLQRAMVGPIRPLMLTLAGAVLLLLAVACLNIANLLLAHAHARTREFAVRAAIGASRGRLVRQLWTENVALFLIAGAAGTAMAGPLARALVAWYPGDLPLAADIRVDAHVLVAASLITLCALLLAATPQIRRLRAVVIGGALGGGQRTGVSRDHRRIASMFLVVQVALSTVLLVGGALLLRTFTNLTSIDPGFSLDGVVAIRASLPTSVQQSPAAMLAFQDHLTDVAAALPGVEAAAHAMFIPFAPGYWGDAYTRPGEPLRPGAGPMAHFYMVSPRYLDVMGVPIVRGRGLLPTDSAAGPRVLVVSEAFARQAFPDGHAVGRRIAWNDDTWTIVGIARDVRHESLWAQPDADAYVPRSQVPRAPTWLLVRTRLPAPAVAAALFDRLKTDAPSLALTDAATMAGLVSGTLAPERFRALLTGTIAALSLLLAVVGLHGVVAYAVSRRTREIGVRMALGARASSVLVRILGETGRTVAIGLAPGVFGAVALARWLTAQGVVQASLSGVIGVIVLVFAAATFVAAIVPALRASRVNPVVALRDE